MEVVRILLVERADLMVRPPPTKTGASVTLPPLPIRRNTSRMLLHARTRHLLPLNGRWTR